MVPTTSENQTDSGTRIGAASPDRRRTAVRSLKRYASQNRNASDEPDSPDAELTPRAFIAILQRTLDILFSLALLIGLFPLFFVIALIIKLDSRGPVLFIQKRVGKGGREFPLYKFRSMIPNAEQHRQKLEEKNENDGPLFKIKNDPRMTRCGRVLRKYSLDELPQFLNILRGEMSLIGPRPALPSEVAQYTPYQRQRLIVTPGLTGLWQVSGRADLPFDRSVELDLHYIRHQSIGLNLKIVLMTVPAIISAKGAY